jgi:hypothetical protein
MTEKRGTKTETVKVSELSVKKKNKASGIFMAQMLVKWNGRAPLNHKIYGFFFFFLTAKFHNNYKHFH